MQFQSIFSGFWVFKVSLLGGLVLFASCSDSRPDLRKSSAIYDSETSENGENSDGTADAEQNSSDADVLANSADDEMNSGIDAVSGDPTVNGLDQSSPTGESALDMPKTRADQLSDPLLLGLVWPNMANLVSQGKSI